MIRIISDIKQNINVLVITSVLLFFPFGKTITSPNAADTKTPMIRAQLKAINEPIISSRIAGVVSHLKLQSGDNFKKNDLLIKINCTPHQKQLKLAQVILSKKQKILKINQRLNQLGSISELEMAVSSAEMEEAEAALAYQQFIVQECSIYAPFSGRVGDLFVDQYQYVNEGEPIMQISEKSQLEIEMLVPSLWLQWLGKGHSFRLQVDETGNTYPARIDRIAAKVDPVSHTVKVFGRFTRPTPDLIPGMSGQAGIVPPAITTGD